MNNILKNKTFIIVVSICLLIFLLMGFTVYRMFYPSSGSIYGDRLDNAPEIDNAVIEQIKNKMMDTNLVEEVKYETKVATMKFFVTVKDNTKLKDAQKLDKIVLDTLSTKITNFYDIQISLINESNDDYPSIGYHSKSASSFNWIDNVGEEDEE